MRVPAACTADTTWGPNVFTAQLLSPSAAAEQRGVFPTAGQRLGRWWQVFPRHPAAPNLNGGCNAFTDMCMPDLLAIVEYIRSLATQYEDLLGNALA